MSRTFTDVPSLLETTLSEQGGLPALFFPTLLALRVTVNLKRWVARAPAVPRGGCPQTAGAGRTSPRPSGRQAAKRPPEGQSPYGQALRPTGTRAASVRGAGTGAPGARPPAGAAGHPWHPAGRGLHRLARRCYPLRLWTHLRQAGQGCFQFRGSGSKRSPAPAPQRGKGGHGDGRSGREAGR